MGVASLWRHAIVTLLSAIPEAQTGSYEIGAARHCGVTPISCVHVYRGELRCLYAQGLAQPWRTGQTWSPPGLRHTRHVGQLSVVVPIRRHAGASSPCLDETPGTHAGSRRVSALGRLAAAGMVAIDFVPCPTLACGGRAGETAGLVSWHIPVTDYPFRTNNASTARDRRLAESGVGPTRRDPPWSSAPTARGTMRNISAINTTAYRFMALPFQRSCLVGRIDQRS